MTNPISNSWMRMLTALLVVGSSGCADDEAAPIATSREALTVPAPLLRDYAVLARHGASFGDRTQVTGGDLGVAPSSTSVLNVLTGNIDSRLGVGQVLLSQRVVLRDRAVAGEIGATVIEVGAGVVTGPRSAFVAPPAIPAPGSVVPGTAAVNVSGGQTTALAAGRYGAVTVGGILNLSGGLYEVQTLRLNPDARVVALASSVLRVSGGVVGADRSRIVAQTSLGAGGLRLLVSGTVDSANNSVALGTDVQLNALVVASGIFRAADRLIATGAIAAQDVIVANDGRVTYSTGFECSSNAGCNDSNPCTVDTCVDTRCSFAPAANGTVCSDGNACTQVDTCQAGTCTGANPVVCTASDQCHVAGTCNPASGMCSNPVSPNGTACNDANACTQVDTCQAGTCTGASPVVCTASDQCHVAGTCNPASGMCSNPASPNGTTCNDANACTQVDTCQAGTCTGSSPVVCTAQDQCHDPGSCDPYTGACSNPAKADGSACDDGTLCTQADTCQAGACEGSAPVVCTASDQCHDAGSCDPETGACSDVELPDGTACDDGNACTLGDACEAGVCAAGTDYAITEFASGVTTPSAILSGPLGSLWYAGRETSAGSFDGSIGRITTAGAVTASATFARDPHNLLVGPDGYLWVAERFLGGLPALGRFDTATSSFVSDYFPAEVTYDMAASNDGGTPVVWLTAGGAVVRIDPAGTILSTTPTRNTARAITAAAPNPATTIWLTEASASGTAYIGRITFPTLAQFPIATPGELFDLVEGPDGNIWFTDAGKNDIGRLGPDGATLAEFPIPTAASTPYGIASGPDGALWFTERDANQIGRITTDGQILELCIPTAGSGPTSIAAGPDGNIWFTESLSGKIGRVTLPTELELGGADADPEALEAKATSGAPASGQGCAVRRGAGRAGMGGLLSFVALGLLAGGHRRRARTQRRMRMLST